MNLISTTISAWDEEETTKKSSNIDIMTVHVVTSLHDILCVSFLQVQPHQKSQREHASVNYYTLHVPWEAQSR